MYVRIIHFTVFQTFLGNNVFSLNWSLTLEIKYKSWNVVFDIIDPKCKVKILNFCCTYIETEKKMEINGLISIRHNKKTKQKLTDYKTLHTDW